MKKALPYLVLLAIIFSSYAVYKTYCASQLVYVDVNMLIENYKKTKLVKQEFEKKNAAMKANVDSLMNDWQIELKQYEKERASLSPKELQLKQELLTNKQQQLNAYQEGVQKRMLEEDKAITQGILSEINEYVFQYGESHGYKIIFGANGAGAIMYADDSADLTDEVLKGLNSQI